MLTINIENAWIWLNMPKYTKTIQKIFGTNSSLHVK